MSELDARRAVGQMLQSGFYHHNYEDEKNLMHRLLQGPDWDGTLAEFSHPMQLYKDMLGPTKVRSAKNMLISAATLLSRAAIDNGVDAEYSFAVSDYYLNSVEQAATVTEIQDLLYEMIRLYRSYVQDRSYMQYSLLVMRGIRFIRNRVYSTITPSTVASHLAITPAHLSRLFKKETGLAPSAYIENCKLKEACALLRAGSLSILEISEALGFCSPSYFAKRFKMKFGVVPSQFIG